MKRILLLCMIAANALAAGARQPAPEAGILLQAYYRFTFVKEAQSGAQSLVENRSVDIARQVEGSVGRWAAREKQAIRASLQERFGAQAKESFAFFVGRYTEAEQRGDMTYLGALNSQIGQQKPPASYAELRQYASDTWLKKDIDALSGMMANIQTWVDLAAAGRNVPLLEAWLARDEPAAPIYPANPLAAAEPTMPVLADDATSGVANVLDAYRDRQAERRDRAAAEAQAAMKQVADERRAAEEDDAKAKAAEAQREAGAVQAYAQKLAETEKEATEQRQNTWSARFKRLAVAVVGGGATAVTSGIGAAAGASVAEAIFD